MQDNELKALLGIEDESIPAMFHRNAARFDARPFLSVKRDGHWQTITWREAERMVRDFALGLVGLGVHPGDRVAIFSGNRPEWAIADLAILGLGAADVPIYATNSPEEARYILHDAGCRVCIVSGREHLDRVLAVRDRLPGLEIIISFEPVPEADGETVLTFDQMLARGRGTADPADYDRRRQLVGLDDVATLIYTSGTTGPPKGVMLTQRNFVFNVYQAYRSHSDMLETGSESSLSFLPLSHSLERLAGWYLMMFIGAHIHYAGSFQTVPDDMKEVRPSFVISVPRLFEKLYSGIHEKVAAAPAYRRRLFHWAVATGRAATPYQTANRPLPLHLRAGLALARRLVHEKLKAAIGFDRMRVFVSGGGPLAREIQEFFHAIGIVVHEGYGLTETTPVTTVQTFRDLRFGTVGKAVLGTEIKIAGDGEILIKGPQVMKGYWNLPADTAEAFTVDGWFKTGDIGEIEDGFLKITDRKKDLIITAGGKNIAPQNIENMLKVEPFIEQAAVLGDARKYLVALIVPAFDELEKWAGRQKLVWHDRAGLVALPEVRRHYEEIVARTNEQLARVEQIKRFALIDREFSQDGGELTPTLKLKRKVVIQKYGRTIDSLYEG